VALAPGSVGASKRWTYYPEAARLLAERGPRCLGGRRPRRKGAGAEIVAAGGPASATSPAPICATAFWRWRRPSVAISNDSGLMHIAAAIGTPTMGIFGPTSPYHWAPLNGLAATVQTKTVVPCQPCHRPVCTMNDHRCMRDIPASDVVEIASACWPRPGRALRIEPRACAAARDHYQRCRIATLTVHLEPGSKDPIAAHLSAIARRAERATQDAALLATARKIAAAIIAALRSGNKLLIIGNGGSAADAQHIAAEIVGRYKQDRPGYAAIALTTDTSALTAIANDYGFEQVFARQVEGLGQRGDVLLALSTSGVRRTFWRRCAPRANAGLSPSASPAPRAKPGRALRSSVGRAQRRHAGGPANPSRRRARHLRRDRADHDARGAAKK
jgi:phosphoheptose isomerase